ncbi:nicotinate (nicotinamide) nucleotide adenylyltransferase [Kwoniella shandongensis]|uniref:Nicotinate (Nicotinamide) nucleotide adenylyltransferase n=1 Tax=Kwoniella shandongensis TaxID=1734106 RepID=A0A5M6C1Q3_9TREE|nr:nicotinate (nicotinamide) nucleotide adenylyltransferase [Kwoniella shandongensis]KAA5528631.1 nicotinate (nicotinamide) nucleotide adenylyltransferase [Kwoniella shandongensis]
MATNGFKSPAPVLPAMGLHSFHNDSPPFAGAATSATSEHGEPEALSLDSSQTFPPRPDSASPQIDHIPLDSPPLSASESIAITIKPNQPIRDTSSSLTLSGDEHLSSSRSRRLLSGYRFGNPPSPVGVIPGSDRDPLAEYDLQAETAALDIGEIESSDSKISRKYSPSLEEARYSQPLPTPPIRDDDDSPPLSEAFKSYSSPDNASTPAAIFQQQQPLLSPNHTAQGKDTVTVTKAAKGPVPTTSTAGANHRDDAGYDALDGRNDGEADLDESAPQAEGGGSEAYLQGKGEYEFPRHRLRRTMKDESKIPLVIVACGSFSPPTYLHLRMFEMAKDEIVESQTYEIMAGYYSPVSSYYKKSGLAPANHRVRMCELAVEHTSTWLMVDPWEAGQSEYQRTAIVLDHFDEMLNGGKDGEGGCILGDGKKRRYKIMLLAGGDLIESFGEPGVWSEPDLHIILGRFGCLIVERAGSDVWAFLLSHDILYHHRRNVIVIKQLIYNDISSTKVRLFVRRGMSIKYLLPNSVIQYIYDHKLYRGSDTKALNGY